MGKLRHSPCASMAEYPVHSCLGSESMFQQSPGSLKRKTCKASHPGTLPAACPSDMDKRWPQGTTARAAPSGNRDVTLRSACRRSPQAQCAIVYSKHRLSAGRRESTTCSTWHTQPSSHSFELSAYTYTSALFQPLMTQSSDCVKIDSAKSLSPACPPPPPILCGCCRTVQSNIQTQKPGASIPSSQD